MSELLPSDDSLNALSGTTDADTGVQFVAIYESPYYTSFYRMIAQLLTVARRAGDFRVFQDGSATFGVRAGRFTSSAGAVVLYAGSQTQALTDNAVNSIYLDDAGELTVETYGFPTAAHLPLATITVTSGSYDLEDIVDCRGACLFRALPDAV